MNRCDDYTWLFGLARFQTFTKNWLCNINFGDVAVNRESDNSLQSIFWCSATSDLGGGTRNIPPMMSKEEWKTYRNTFDATFAGDKIGASNCFLRQAETSDSKAELCTFSFLTSESNESHRLIMTFISSGIAPVETTPFDDRIYLWECDAWTWRQKMNITNLEARE